MFNDEATSFVLCAKTQSDTTNTDLLMTVIRKDLLLQTLFIKATAGVSRGATFR
jgi:hypothetical protein